MTAQALKIRLYAIACDSLRDANRKSPFTTKAEAMRDINRAAKLANR